MKKSPTCKRIRDYFFNSWFPILSLIICVINIARTQTMQASELLFAIIIFCIASLITTWRDKTLERLQRIYSEQVSLNMLYVMRYICGIMAIVCSFALVGYN